MKSLLLFLLGFNKCWAVIEANFGGHEIKGVYPDEETARQAAFQHNAYRHVLARDGRDVGFYQFASEEWFWLIKPGPREKKS